MFHFGVDYYPEHWPKERWPEDARLMAEAGMNVVRLAEFAWSRMEPQEGVYDFDWLDRAISILEAHGIQVVLGTPTALPPPWLMAKNPGAFRVREDGQRRTFGNRREYCPNHPAYHQASQRIVTRMAEHYAEHPSIIGWQIDNEFGDRCYCPVCAKAFQDWLRRRFVTLDELNERWGTIFWSHMYTDWDQIPVPATTGESPNPGLALDYFRFMSDSYVTYQQMQIDLLKAQCPKHFITHNLMGFKYELINYFDLARSLDFVTWDNYQRTQWSMHAQVDPSQGALAADTMRGLKSQNFWVMEQQAGSGGWDVVSVPPRPGELRLWAYQTIAHGADAVIFFRWRTARFGTEQSWHGLLDHDGYLSRRYMEIKHMGTELSRIGDQIHGSTISAAVAMVLSYDSRFAFQIQKNNPDLSYPAHFLQVYRALHRLHVPVDIVAPTGNLSKYRLVIAPALHVVSKAAAENLARFVAGGGVLVVTPRSGVKDEANAVVNQRLPGLLAELCGADVEEYDSLAPDMGNELEFSVPELIAHSPVPAGAWCDVLQSNGAEVVAAYTQEYYAGRPAITLNQFGKGQVLYVGVLNGSALYEALTGWLLGLTGVQSILSAPEGVEVTERWQDDRRLLFVLNHSDETHDITLRG
ncbi:MAG TPA: beta-galactosidase, partial [Anaerolineae bacterium]|nr:beta-galactosidase [Anaerolineae bacterium]